MSILRLLAALLFCAGTASAQPNCGHIEKVRMMLQAQYSERQAGVGLSTPGTYVAELWISEGGGTFTIIATYPNGMSCILASGRGWSAHSPSFAKKGDPT